LINWGINPSIYIAVPLLVLLFGVVLGLSIRLLVNYFVRKQKQTAGWLQKCVIDTLWQPILYWSIFLGTYASIQVSTLSPVLKRFGGSGVASLFVLSVMWVVCSLIVKVFKLYFGRVETGQSLIVSALNVVRAGVVLIGILTILSIWGAPTELVVIILVAILLIVGLALRDNFSNILGWIEIIYTEHIKVGHFIKLASGEEGYVSQVSWTKTVIRNNEGNLLIIPNEKLIKTTIANYGATTDQTSVADFKRNLTPVGLLQPSNILSDRELEVLKLIGKGATNREIAKVLVISEHTVKSHLHSILKKLNIHNRQQAAVYAEREGML
jgi:small-conductance mechanosensitive channel/DNA-binding CsgD family transcriptional regulator